MCQRGCRHVAKNLVVTAAVSCDHYKGGELHSNWEWKRSPLVLIKCFLCIYLSLTSWQLPVAIARTFLPTLFVLLEKGVPSWFISRISRLPLWQVPSFLYFIVQLNSYQMSWVRPKKSSKRLSLNGLETQILQNSTIFAYWQTNSPESIQIFDTCILIWQVTLKDVMSLCVCLWSQSYPIHVAPPNNNQNRRLQTQSRGQAH